VAECRRALWLLGVAPPTDHRGVLVAWRKRVAQTHPDRHLGDAAREEAAAKLTRALNEAREVLEWWIDEDRDWPPPEGGSQQVRLDEFEPEVWPERQPESVAPVDPITGLRAGDRVRAWPFDGDLLTVVETEMDVRDHSSWVRVAERDQAIKSDRIRLAAYSCPTCGACAGPLVEDAEVRPCPECLIDLRRLAKSPAEAARIRRAIEARATAGESEAEAIGDGRFADRARERRRWARRLITAQPDDLHAALLGAFGSAWERWGETRADERRR
jgi:hypothetical protein